MKKAELDRLAALLLMFFEDGSPDELRSDVSRVRQAVLDRSIEAFMDARPGQS